jgi:hypothetical protein
VFDKRADVIYIRTHHAVKNKEDINFCVAQFHYFGTRYVRVHRKPITASYTYILYKRMSKPHIPQHSIIYIHTLP